MWLIQACKKRALHINSLIKKKGYHAKRKVQMWNECGNIQKQDKTKKVAYKQKAFSEMNWIITNGAHFWYGEDRDMIDELRF